MKGFIELSHFSLLRCYAFVDMVVDMIQWIIHLIQNTFHLEGRKKDDDNFEKTIINTHKSNQENIPHDVAIGLKEHTIQGNQVQCNMKPPEDVLKALQKNQDFRVTK